MSITVADIQTSLNTYIGDTSTDRISAAERLSAITEATLWLMEETNNDLMNASYEFNYYDTIHVYKITTAVPDVLDTVDIVRAKDQFSDNNSPFDRVSPRDIKLHVADGFSTSEYALERKDSDWYLLVNHDSKYAALQLASFESTTADGGEWLADESTSDALNLEADSTEYVEGSVSLKFDIDVSQSGNNRAVIYNDDATERDLTDYQDLASFIIDVYIPDVTDFSSVTLYWGSSSTAYWSFTQTTDMNGNAFVDGWNTLKFDWASATKTSTPDVTAINYYRVDFNYGAGQGDDEGFRIDDLRLVRPETLTFLYTSNFVGTNSSGTDVRAFAATTDIPYFSGKYDGLKFAVAHRAAAILFRGLRLRNEAVLEDTEALKALDRTQNIFPQSTMKETRKFRPAGIRWRKSSRNSRR
jgi:hypothetical protein